MTVYNYFFLLGTVKNEIILFPSPVVGLHFWVKNAHFSVIISARLPKLQSVMLDDRYIFLNVLGQRKDS